MLAAMAASKLLSDPADCTSLGPGGATFASQLDTAPQSADWHQAPWGPKRRVRPSRLSQWILGFWGAQGL